MRAPLPQFLFRASLWCFAAITSLIAPSLRAQGGATVTTIGGAFAGYVDGDNTASQFNTPWALALDNTAENLFIVDRGNKVLRKMRLTTLLVTTQIPALNKPNPLVDPVAVAVDRSNFIYVADQGNGTVRRFDLDANLRSTPASGLNKPVAIALDARTNLFIAEQSGTVRRVSATGEQAVLFTVPGGGKVPQLAGLTLLDAGNVAVSDAANHAIWLYSAKNNSVTVLSGNRGAGFTEGPFGFAQFNQPQQISRGPNNSIVVADRGNHRVRVVTCDGAVSTAYGIDPTQWFSEPLPGVFPGWDDGSSRFAEVRDPIGITVGADGTIFGTESFYHIIRRVAGVVYPASSCGGQSTNAVANPIITPNAGYFPLGVTVEVTSPDDNPFSSETRLFYTLDGSEPTTNSIPVALEDGRGLITLHNTRLDLRSLRVRAFEGTNASLTITGQTPTFSLPNQVGEIGVPPSIGDGSISGGVGSTIVFPVVANLRADQRLRSLQFLLDITPNGEAPPITPPLQVRAVQMSDGDFIPVVAGSTNLPTILTAQVGTSSRLAIAYIGTNTVFSVNTFGVVAMIALPIPFTAREGQSYTLHVSKISGTSDGVEASVLLQPMTDRTVVVRNVSYLVGDSSPAFWYDAGDFGNGRLDNSDVNNAFFASLGFRVPYTFSDLFDAMDVFPEDTPPNAGGDGTIRFLDWQVLLRRSIGLDANNYLRHWSPEGFRVSESTTLQDGFSSETPLTRIAATKAWNKQVAIQAGSVGNAKAGSSVRVPVSLRVRQGASVGGLQFAAQVNGSGAAPTNVRFLPANNVPAPGFSGIYPSPTASLYTAWNLGALSANNGTVMGDIAFDIPAGTPSGSIYKVSFSSVDGASVSGTQIEFESVHGAVYVGTPASADASPVGDEWVQTFFGYASNPDAAANADPDQDGFTNSAEWASGTDPLHADARFEVRDGHFVVRWFAAAGKTFQVQRASKINQWENVGGAVNGSDSIAEFADSNPLQNAQFYRIKTLAP